MSEGCGENKRKSEGNSENNENENKNVLVQRVTLDSQIGGGNLTLKKPKLKDESSRSSANIKSRERENSAAKLLPAESVESSKTYPSANNLKSSALPRLRRNNISNSTALAVPTRTPIKGQVELQTKTFSANRITESELLSRLKELTVHNASVDTFKYLFENVIKTSVNDILSVLNVKVKSKWDLQEKIKKHEAAMKVCKDLTVAHYNELNELKMVCESRDDRIIAILVDCINSLRENDIQVEASLVAEHNLNSKLKQATEKLIDVEQRYHSMFSEQLWQRDENSALRQQIDQMKVVISDLDKSLLQTQAENALAESEKNLLIFNYNNKLAAQHEQHDTETKSYKEKLDLMSAKYDRLESDFERLQIEKSKLEHKNSELEQLQNDFQARIRDSESNVIQYGKDVKTLQQDLNYTREQLALKDTDLRCTLNSLNENQRLASEEKSSLWAELSLLKHRLQILEEERCTLTSQLAAKREESLLCNHDLTQLREKFNELATKCREIECELSVSRSAATQLEVEKELRARAEMREQSERIERVAATAQSMAIESECNNRLRNVEEQSYQETIKFSQKISLLEVEKNNLVQRLQDSMEVIMRLENEVVSLKKAIDNASANQNVEAVKELSKATGELEVMRRKIKDLTDLQDTHGAIESQKLAEYQDRLQASENQRRKLHNLIQELRGNIRVFARVRPFLPNDGIDTQLSKPVVIASTETNSIRMNRQNEENKLEEHVFQFDKVFGPTSSQECVFGEVSEFVQSALDGYHVCLFSYGQTGSGKTHTMQGCGVGVMRGIIPRAMEQVGVYKSELESKGWEYKMEVTFIEIYNENIRDLLRSGNSSSESEKKHEITRDTNNDTYISDTTTIDIDPNNVDQITEIMQIASRHRSVGSTAMNNASSRSHSVFTLHLRAWNSAQKVTLKGSLSLVDLAGSERLERSHVTGAQLKETVSINKSLSALTNVFIAIGNKQAHIPYRNSKLTHLLQPALSGDGKTLMMVNLSPTEESFSESLCSLRLANQVNRCELGKPKKQVKEFTAACASSNSKELTCVAWKHQLSSTASSLSSTCTENSAYGVGVEKRKATTLSSLQQLADRRRK